MSEQPPHDASQRLDVKISDEEMKGRYANLLRVTHTREEFILDFIHVVPPQGIVTARVATSPGHLKRIVRTLAANLARYEEAFGTIPENPGPESAAKAN
jgi:hypothetical protein